MTRPATALLAAVVWLLPAASALGHLDTELHPPFAGREIVVTGHDELDPLLHIETSSGIVLVQCLECVLDKRQSGAHQQSTPAPDPCPLDSRARVVEAWSRLFQPPASGSPRAPPLV